VEQEESGLDPYIELADWIDAVVTRADNLVDVAKGNHCLTRPDGDWTRQIALAEGLRGIYDANVVSMILFCLLMRIEIDPYEGDAIRQMNNEYH
jgi:hypothetical protein